jgi:hypothetical protein
MIVRYKNGDFLGPDIAKTALGQTRSSGDVGSMSGLPEGGHG